MDSRNNKETEIPNLNEEKITSNTANIPTIVENPEYYLTKANDIIGLINKNTELNNIEKFISKSLESPSNMMSDIAIIKKELKEIPLLINAEDTKRKYYSSTSIYTQSSLPITYHPLQIDEIHYEIDKEKITQHEDESESMVVFNKNITLLDDSDSLYDDATDNNIERPAVNKNDQLDHDEIFSQNSKSQSFVDLNNVIAPAIPHIESDLDLANEDLVTSPENSNEFEDKNRVQNVIISESEHPGNDTHELIPANISSQDVSDNDIENLLAPKAQEVESLNQSGIFGNDLSDSDHEGENLTCSDYDKDFSALFSPNLSAVNKNNELDLANEPANISSQDVSDNDIENLLAPKAQEVESLNQSGIFGNDLSDSDHEGENLTCSDYDKDFSGLFSPNLSAVNKNNELDLANEDVVTSPENSNGIEDENKVAEVKDEKLKLFNKTPMFGNDLSDSDSEDENLTCSNNLFSDLFRDSLPNIFGSEENLFTDNNEQAKLSDKLTLNARNLLAGKNKRDQENWKKNNFAILELVKSDEELNFAPLSPEELRPSPQFTHFAENADKSCDISIDDEKLAEEIKPVKKIETPVEIKPVDEIKVPKEIKSVKKIEALMEVKIKNLQNKNNKKLNSELEAIELLKKEIEYQSKVSQNYVDYIDFFQEKNPIENKHQYDNIKSKHTLLIKKILKTVEEATSTKKSYEELNAEIFPIYLKYKMDEIDSQKPKYVSKKNPEPIKNSSKVVDIKLIQKNNDSECKRELPGVP